MTTIINVTKEDIELGKMKTIHYCPVALAIKRKFPSANVFVAYYAIAVGDDMYLTSQEIRTFISKFDSGQSVEPFQFDVDALKIW